MDNNGESSYKYIDAKELETKMNYANNSSAGEVYLTDKKQREIKKLILSTLDDPRNSYKSITIDELTSKWDFYKEKTINSN